MLIVAGIVIGLAVGVGGATGFHMASRPGLIVPGVSVMGVDVGGLTIDEAERYLARHFEAKVKEPIQIYLGGESWSELPANLGVDVDLRRMVEAAGEVGQSGSLIERMWTRLVALSRGVDIPIDVAVDQRAVEEWLERIAASVERPPKDASLIVSPDGLVSIVPSQTGYTVERSGVAERLAQVALQSSPRGIRLILNPVAPARSTEALRGEGDKSLLSAFTTQFDPSDANRTANIRIAAKALDGLVIEPGGLFSFNRTVGPRIEAFGYKEAPVIIDGELVPDIGGGVCQVSTTLYNAVLLAGLKVNTRIAHSIPSAYVPLGRDATVAYDYIDFKFENNTDAHILVKSWVEENELTIAFYGADPGPRRIRLETEVAEVLQPRVTYVRKEDLEEGEEQVVQQGREGYRVNVWRIVEEDGSAPQRQLVSRSYYQPRERIVWVGS